MLYRTLLLLFALSQLAACAAPQTKQLLDKANTDPWAPETRINTPFVPQEDLFCGPATMSMALAHKGKQVGQDTIAKEIFTPNKKGTLQVDMTSFAREQGFVVYPVSPNLESLIKEVSAGHPVIVLQNLGFSWWPKWHYALVIGHNIKNKEITLHSGTNPNYTISLNTFERTWARSNYWGFALLSPQDLPAENAPEKLIDAVIESDLHGNKDKAKQFYLSITKKWPAQHLAWFALGNRYYSDGDLELSIDAFLRASKLDKQDSYFNNLAYAIAEYGCLDYANAVLDCGLDHFPNSTILQKTKREIQHFSAGSNSCPKFECAAH